MKYYCSIFLLLFLLNAELTGQEFIVDRVPFSSRINDEFSPVFYKGGIVYCSNMRDNSLVGYNDRQDKLFKIFYIRKDSLAWRHPVLFSDDLTSGFNDGPVSFSADGKIIYYSRNNSVDNVLKDISDTTNKLGIYSAYLSNGKWTGVKALDFVNQLYSFCTPSVSPDGNRIYFSSDMPGGYGGMDLYFSDKMNESWGQPVNLGNVINTSKNESFPFSCRYGRLYFSSDGHGGFGGKDLFYTQEINGSWIPPVSLDSGINSPADDFGMLMDSTLQQGYFSSNRFKTDDIFSLRKAPVEFAHCDTIRENNYCFTFYDERHHLIDTLPVSYIWNFGDGIIKKGIEVKHCFPGPGKYIVNLIVTDNLTGDTISEHVSYDVQLENIEQAYINSLNIGVVDEPVSFDGQTINLKNFSITDYLWDFGAGFKPGGPAMENTFRKDGDYLVKLGLLGEKDDTGSVPQKCYMKKIKIFNSYKELGLNSVMTDNLQTADIDSAKEKKLEIRVYFMDDLSERQKSKIKTMINLTDPLIAFNQNGISVSSYSLLDNIISILNQNQDLLLEMVTSETAKSLPGNDFSELWSQELAFYFRNMESDPLRFKCRNIKPFSSAFRTSSLENHKADGVVEFIFMKK